MDWDAVLKLFYSMHCINDGADLKSSILILPLWKNQRAQHQQISEERHRTACACVIPWSPVSPCKGATSLPWVEFF